MEGKITFTLGEVIGMFGGLVSFAGVVIAFFIKRTVFKEIDSLKEGKQDKPFCITQKTLCNQEQTTLCEDIKEVKVDMKEGRKEFKSINGKLDRLMGAMHLKFDDLNGTG